MFITLLCWLSENPQKLLLNKHWDGNDVETVIMLMAHKTEAGWDVLISAGWICRYSTHPVHTSVPHCPYHVSCTCTYLDMQVFNAPCTSVPHSLPWTLYPVPCTWIVDVYVGIQRTFYRYSMFHILRTSVLHSTISVIHSVPLIRT